MTVPPPVVRDSPENNSYPVGPANTLMTDAPTLLFPIPNCDHEASSTQVRPLAYPPSLSSRSYPQRFAPYTTSLPSTPALAPNSGTQVPSKIPVPDDPDESLSRLSALISLPPWAPMDGSSSLLSLATSPTNHPPLLPDSADPSNDLSFASARRNYDRLQEELNINKTIIGMSISIPNPVLTPLSPSSIHHPSIHPSTIHHPSIQPSIHHPSIPTPISQHLPNSIDDILPPPYRPPSPTRRYPEEFIRLVRLIARRKTKTPLLPPLSFEVSHAAAESNASILRDANYDVSTLIAAHPDSLLSYGSEFRSPSLLHPLLRKHPLWPYLRRTLEHGAEFALTTEPDDNHRREENTALIEYENHKSAKDNDGVILSNLASEVSYGFALVIPLAIINLIKHSMVVPLGIAEQFTVDANGNRIPKRRLTHDQTFEHTDKGQSSNNLTDKDKLPPMIYGHCLLRIIHHILILRFRHPFKIIFINKVDFSKAYRRIQYSGRGAAQCIAVHNNLGYLELRLSFGGSGCPPTWCTVSEIVTDLANDLILCPDWNPDICQSPLQHLVPTPSRLPADIPFENALPMAFEPPAYPEGKSDCFVDDVTTVFLDTAENCVRTPAAVPLAIHLLNRPLATDEPILRVMFMALDKLLAEGGPSEQGIILGWFICTRRLIIGLPDDKFSAWSKDISDCIASNGTSFKLLTSLIGRLENATTIIPQSQYFLNRIRGLLLGKSEFRKHISLTESTTADLRLWLRFLQKANEGTNLNLLAIRRPSHILFSDACPGGLGGYSLSTGLAWQLNLSDTDFHPSVSNNLLEFIGAIAQIWFTVAFDPNCPPLSCLLAWTDNSSGAGWLHRSNFAEHSEEAHDSAARKLANILIDHSCIVFPQHIQGDHNSVADTLSRNFDLSPPDLTSFILSNFPSQVPANFRIVPLPNEISSWIFSTVTRKQESMTPRQQGHTTRTIAPGTAGPSSSTKSVSTATPTSTTFQAPPGAMSAPASSNAASAETSPTQNESNNWIENLRTRYSAGLYRRPLGTWLRNSGVLGGLAPFTTMSAPTKCSPSSMTYSRPGRTRTQPRNVNGP